MDKDIYDEQTERLLPCSIHFNSGKILCVTDDNGTLWHVEGCPAKYRPTVAAALREEIEWRNKHMRADAAKIISLRAEIAALKAKLAIPTNDGITHYEGCWKDRGHHACALAKIAELEKKP